MNIIGKKVKHKMFGEGMIIEQKETKIKVQFANKISQFSYPEAFNVFLMSEDAELQTIVEARIEEKRLEEIAKKEAAAKAAEEEAKAKEVIHVVKEKNVSAAVHPKIHNTNESVDNRINKPRILFCNIAYMRFYDLNTDYDIPKGGGKYVEESGNAHEKINFHVWPDEIVRGFTLTKGVWPDSKWKIHIEKISPDIKSRDEEAEDVTVVFCAKNPRLQKRVIIGWYDHATVLRHGRLCPDDSERLPYMCYTRKGNAHLLAEQDRIYPVPNANKDGFGMGQSNIWYADKEEAFDYIDKVLEYLQSMRAD